MAVIDAAAAVRQCDLSAADLHLPHSAKVVGYDMQANGIGIGIARQESVFDEARANEERLCV
jgi:hypothetical protein